MPRLQHAQRCLGNTSVLEGINREVVGTHTVDERVQDGHGTVGDTSVRVDLLEN